MVPMPLTIDFTYYSTSRPRQDIPRLLQFY